MRNLMEKPQCANQDVKSRGGSRGEYDFLAYNRDFSHEIPQNFRASLRNWKKYDYLA